VFWGQKLISQWSAIRPPGLGQLLIFRLWSRLWGDKAAAGFVGLFLKSTKFKVQGSKFKAKSKD
jgi:hypothetical protein